MDNTSHFLSCYAVSGARGTSTKTLFWIFHPAKQILKFYAVTDFPGKLVYASKCSFVIAMLVFISGIASAQSLSGLYLTKSDFENNLLSNRSTNKGDWLKVSFNEDIVISRNGSITRFRHHEVYGYFAEGYKHIGWGSRRKFFSRAGYYKVLDTAGLIVLHTRVRNHKFAHDRYVYCRTLEGNKKLLTLRNLSNDFPYHSSFIQTIKSSGRPYRLHQMVDGMTLLNRVYLELVKPVEEKWPKGFALSAKPADRHSSSASGLSSRHIALTSLYYHWYGNK